MFCLLKVALLRGDPPSLFPTPVKVVELADTDWVDVEEPQGNPKP